MVAMDRLPGSENIFWKKKKCFPKQSLIRQFYFSYTLKGPVAGHGVASLLSQHLEGRGRQIRARPFLRNDDKLGSGGTHL